MNREELGSRLAEIRKQKGLSQRAISELLKFDHAYYARIEKGKTAIGFDLLNKICDALDHHIELVETLHC